ncbi:MAG: type II toxin-antitoxin system VapC family toxin [Bacillota bacterium]|nr:type II toxin-antitoxin system VapC family toxin [Bacillota bacterium]
MTVCIDASVVVKLAISEPDSASAHDWFRSNRDQDVISPATMAAEVTSVLTQKIRRADMTTQQGLKALRLIARLGIRLYSDWGLMESASAIATELEQATAYDTVYLALAEREQCDLLTADAAFARACRDKYPRVRVL